MVIRLKFGIFRRSLVFRLEKHKFNSADRDRHDQSPILYSLGTPSLSHERNAKFLMCIDKSLKAKLESF